MNPESYVKKDLNLNLSGNRIYCTACFFLVISKNSCSKLHGQRGFNLIIFSYRTWLVNGAVAGLRVLQGVNPESGTRHLWGYNPVQDSCPPHSGRDCVKPLWSSYTGLCPQKTRTWLVDGAVAGLRVLQGVRALDLALDRPACDEYVNVCTRNSKQ